MVILQPALLEQKWELKQLDLITEMLVLLCTEKKQEWKGDQSTRGALRSQPCAPES